MIIVDGEAFSLQRFFFFFYQTFFSILWIIRIQELVLVRQTDKQNVQQIERKLAEERRQKQSIESQLNNERNKRKQTEEKLSR